MNRRHFLVVLGGTAAALTADMAWGEDTPPGDVLDAGALDSFVEQKVYDQFRDQGVLIVRRGDEVFAFSSVCTHKGCKVRVQEDQTFLCKCHQSRFDADGKPLSGPAVTNLLRLKVKLSPENHVLVLIAKPALSG